MDIGHAIILLLAVIVVLWTHQIGGCRLREAHRRYNHSKAFADAMLDHISDGVVACDASGKLIYLNQASRDWYGLPAGPLVPDQWTERNDLYQPDGRTPLPADDIPLPRTFKGKQVLDQEIVIKPCDLAPRLVRCTGAQLHGPGNRKIGAVVVMRDITEQSRAETVAEEALRIIESSTSILFKWRATEGWPAEFVTQNIRQIGYDAHQFLDGSVNYADVIHPDDLERVNAEVLKYADCAADQFYQSYRIIDSSGRERWVDDWTHIVRDADGVITHFHGFITDTTEREVMSMLLKDSEERTDLALIGSELGMWDWDIPNRKAVFNARSARILGYDLEDIDMRYKTWERLIHPDEWPLTFANLQAHFAGTTDLFLMEFRVRHKEGHWVWIQARGKVLERNDRGEPVRMTGTHLDITRRKQEEQDKIELEDKMRRAQKLESLGVLAGGIAHDFNNILMAVLGNAELASLELPHDAPAAENLREIEMAASRAAGLCNQMLAYSGKGHFKVEILDLSEIVRDIAQMLKVGISKKIQLRYDLANDIPPILADVSQIRQVVMNLITNASEAIGDRNGVITVTTSQQKTCPCDNALVGRPDPCRLAEPCLVFEVSDTGCGMNEETLERLYEPFYTTKFTGRGLGMAAVAGIVRGHGGYIDINTKVEQGTTIRVSLPPAAGHLAAKVKTPVSLQVSHDRGRMLIVDDEDAILRIGKRLIESLGFDVVCAVNGLEAVDRIRSDQEISCVLLDLTMPEMDGIEALSIIRDLRPSLPVIMSSGFHSAEIAERIGPETAFIQKPYRRQELSQLLNKVLAHAKV